MPILKVRDNNHLCDERTRFKGDMKKNEQIKYKSFIISRKLAKFGQRSRSDGKSRYKIQNLCISLNVKRTQKSRTTAVLRRRSECPSAPSGGIFFHLQNSIGRCKNQTHHSIILEREKRPSPGFPGRTREPEKGHSVASIYGHHRKPGRIRRKLDEKKN